MNESFYKPLTTQHNRKPIIIYPCNGCEKVFDRKELSSIEKYVLGLFENQPRLLLPTNQYFIVIIWEYEGNRMADVWIFGNFESWIAGPSAGVMNFNNLNPEIGGDVVAGDGLVMLGREEEQRRIVGKLESYINGPRPTLPEGINPKENFYL